MLTNIFHLRKKNFRELLLLLLLLLLLRGTTFNFNYASIKLSMVFVKPE